MTRFRFPITVLFLFTIIAIRAEAQFATFLFRWNSVEMVQDYAAIPEWVTTVSLQYGQGYSESRELGERENVRVSVDLLAPARIDIQVFGGYECLCFGRAEYELKLHEFVAGKPERIQVPLRVIDESGVEGTATVAQWVFEIFVTRE